MNELLDELKAQEVENMRLLQEKMAGVRSELKKAQQTEKIQHSMLQHDCLKKA